jgi:hypothetical protein
LERSHRRPFTFSGLSLNTPATFWRVYNATRTYRTYIWDLLHIRNVTVSRRSSCETWNAIVGYRSVRCQIFRACPQVSDLLMQDRCEGNKMAYRSTTCYKIVLVNHKYFLMRLFLSKYSSSVSSGSITGTCNGTSGESITPYCSPNMRRDVHLYLDSVRHRSAASFEVQLPCKICYYELRMYSNKPQMSDRVSIRRTHCIVSYLKLYFHSGLRWAIDPGCACEVKHAL